MFSSSVDVDEKKATSFLKAKNSKMMCKKDTIIVAATKDAPDCLDSSLQKAIRFLRLRLIALLGCDSVCAHRSEDRDVCLRTGLASAASLQNPLQKLPRLP